MKVTRWIRQFVPIALVFVLLLTSCSAAPSKYDDVQEETTGSSAPAAVDTEAERGGTFNQFFPDSEGDFSVVPSQEKKGFAEYKLKRDGKTLAMLTVNDTISLPAAASKYENATETIGGFPTVQQGTTATGVLVNGRYQVKVLSRDESFTAEDRAAWLERFDLQGLSQLEADTKSTRRAKAKPLSRDVKLTRPAAERKTAPVLVPQPAG
jgi:hypothetical protein